MIQKEEKLGLERRKLIWVSFLILDIFLHKTSRIEILEHLAKKGYTVYLIAVRSRKKYYEPRHSNIHTITIPLRYFPGVSPILFVGVLLLILPFYIISINPDFIVTDSTVSIFSVIWTPLLSFFKRSKIVLDIRSTPVSLGSYFSTFLFNFSILWAKRFFDGMTIISILMKKEICDKYNIHPRFVGVWTSGVSPELFNPEKHNKGRAELRRKFGLAGKFIVFYHGVFGRRRGIFETIESIGILKLRYPYMNDLVLFLLGNGPALPKMKQIIQQKGIQDSVIIHNPVDYISVPRYIAMCDVGIDPLPNLPDWRHQCPLKLLEYLSMKKAVIVTDIPAHREVIGKSKCGIYVSSTNPVEIAKAIKCTYENRQSLKKLGSYGRTIINKKYAWDIVASDFDHYLDAVEDETSAERRI